VPSWLWGLFRAHQAVESSWALGDHFVEMRFRELDRRPYEAAYLVGLDDRSATYILILADSTGVFPNPSAVVDGRRSSQPNT